MIEYVWYIYLQRKGSPQETKNLHSASSGEVLIDVTNVTPGVAKDLTRWSCHTGMDVSRLLSLHQLRVRQGDVTAAEL